jgi:hypothetical protein
MYVQRPGSAAGKEDIMENAGSAERGMVIGR